MAKIVDWLGTSLGVDADYFVRGGIYGFIQQGVGLICGLVIVYAFGHFVSPAVFGEYNLMLSIISLLAVVSLPGMSMAVLQSVGQSYDRSLVGAVRMRLKWSFMGVPILLGLAYYYQQKGSDVMPALMVLTAVFFPLIYPFSTTQSYFVAKKRFDLQALFAAISSIITAVLVGGAIIIKQNLFWAMLGYFIGTTLPTIVSFWMAKSLVAKESKTDPDLLNYGYFLTGLQILPLATAHLSNILLAVWLGVGQLAIFSVASKFPGIVQKNFDVFYKPVTAKLAGQTIKQHYRTLARHVIKFVVLGATMFAVTWLLLPILIKIFFSQEYRGVINYARWYALSLLFLPVGWFLNDVIMFQKRRHSIMFLQTVLPLVRLVSYFVVIPRWQIGGLIAIILTERMAATVYSAVAILLTPARKN